MSSVRAFGGGPLKGSKLTRVVYLDETGHSAGEPVAAVAGVLLDPDDKWRELADRIDALRLQVPEQFRENFVFHATDLHGGGKMREAWGDEERRRLLKQLLSLPRELSIPLVLGFSKKPEDSSRTKRQESIVSHSVAYGLCLKAADWFMNNHRPDNEIAFVVAEERPEARKAIAATHRLFSNPDMIQKWLPEGRIRDGLPITRIKAPPAFASKEDEPLLQIADAIAWTMQRHLRGASWSAEYIEAVFGRFAHPAALGAQIGKNGNYMCFWWPADLRFYSPSPDV